MNQLVTRAIILSRTDYGEADRILTVLTPQYGKLRLLAKGVRRVKSKLAGGIELFSVSEIAYIRGRGDIGTLVSTRLQKYYGHIVQDLERTMTAYELIKQLNKLTEDEVEEAYFTLLQDAFVALDDAAVGLPLIRFWFSAQLLRLEGQTPNLQTDDHNEPLQADRTYAYNSDRMAFTPDDRGTFDASVIKVLRLTFNGATATALQHIQGIDALVPAAARLVQSLQQHAA